MNIWDNAQTPMQQQKSYHARYVKNRYHSDEVFREKQLEHCRRYREQHPPKTIRSQLIDAAWEWIAQAFPIQSEELPILEISFRNYIKEHEQTLRHPRQPQS